MEKQRSRTLAELRARKLNPRHYKLLRLLLAGYNQLQAAELSDYSPGRANIVINSPVFKTELQRLSGMMDFEFIRVSAVDPVRAVLQSQALKSAQTLVQLRDRSTNERVKQVSALEILDRSGYGKEVKVVGNMTLEVDDSLKTAIQLAINQGKNGEKKDESIK